MKLLFVYTVEASLRTAVKGQVRYLSERGHVVHVAVSPDEAAESWVRSEGGTFHAVRMSRSARDIGGSLKALAALVRLIRRERPDLVVSGSPKAGLLGVLAARLARVPSLYFIHGLRLEGAAGSSQRALVLLERLTCGLAGRVVAVGHGLKQVAVGTGVVSASRVDVVGAGSANGIDQLRFGREDPPAHDGPVFGFVGRITSDKGVADLARAWSLVAAQLPLARLIVLGDADDDSERDRQLVDDLATAGADMRGFVTDPAAAIKEFDVLVLPSLREGLPTVVLEAAAAGVPAVMYRCTGSDVVIDGVTGSLVDVGDWQQLAAAMVELGRSPERVQALGEQAVVRVRNEFAQEHVWRLYEQHYERCARSGISGRAL